MTALTILAALFSLGVGGQAQDSGIRARTQGPGRATPPHTRGASPAQHPCGHERYARGLTYRGAVGEWRPEPELTAELEARVPGAAADPVTLVEVTRYPDCEPTSEQTRAADDFLERAYRIAIERGWFDFERGRKDGFGPYKPHDHGETHFVNLEHSLDDRILDPERPEYLMYYDTPGGEKLLVGMMFFVRTADEAGPQFGGPRTVWHYHSYEEPACLHQMQISSPVESPEGGLRCEEGEVTGFRSPEMLHLWFVDHPGGTYGTRMILPPGVLEKGIRKELLELARP